MSSIIPRLAGCTLTTAHTAARTHTDWLRQGGYDLPVEPLMNVGHNKDEMNGRNKKFNKNVGKYEI